MIYAGIFRRSLAFAIDLLIIASFLFLTTWGVFRFQDGTAGVSFQLILVMGFFFALFPFVYFVYFHACGGQTPGKKALGIIVVEQTGKEAGTLRSVFRVVGYSASMAFFMAGFLWPLFDRRGQAWHDKIAGTVVLEI